MNVVSDKCSSEDSNRNATNTLDALDRFLITVTTYRTKKYQ